MNFPLFSPIRIHLTYTGVDPNKPIDKTFENSQRAEKFLTNLNPSNKISSVFVITLQKTGTKGQNGHIIANARNIEPVDALSFIQTVRKSQYPVIATTAISHRSLASTPSDPTTAPLHTEALNSLSRTPPISPTQLQLLSDSSESKEEPTSPLLPPSGSNQTLPRVTSSDFVLVD